jgi:hypothetical protein
VSVKARNAGIDAVRVPRSLCGLLLWQLKRQQVWKENVGDNLEWSKPPQLTDFFGPQTEARLLTNGVRFGVLVNSSLGF